MQFVTLHEGCWFFGGKGDQAWEDSPENSDATQLLGGKTSWEKFSQPPKSLRPPMFHPRGFLNKGASREGSGGRRARYLKVGECFRGIARGR